MATRMPSAAAGRRRSSTAESAIEMGRSPPCGLGRKTSLVCRQASGSGAPPNTEVQTAARSSNQASGMRSSWAAAQPSGPGAAEALRRSRARSSGPRKPRSQAAGRDTGKSPRKGSRSRREASRPGLQKASQAASFRSSRRWGCTGASGSLAKSGRAGRCRTQAVARPSDWARRAAQRSRRRRPSARRRSSASSRSRGPRPSARAGRSSSSG
mmetsp:Transcript_109887/g.350539  ORF Transcript_109887/g.350539 Transcript_109887/m.350539 type:complete len:212 (+) Transcript_109887:453-1088(+)